jgi:hypothetical protein
MKISRCPSRICDLISLRQLRELGDLSGLPGGIAAEFAGEEFGDAGHHANGGPGVQKRGAGAAREASSPARVISFRVAQM